MIYAYMTNKAYNFEATENIDEWGKGNSITLSIRNAGLVMNESLCN